MDVLERAIVFATKAHAGQKRKLSGTPYILHPIEVASIIATITDDKDVMAAGVLHDTIEDCGVDPLEIRKRFGTRVAALVDSETEDKLATRPPAETWKERKEDSLLMLKFSKERNVKILWLADKLSNMRSFYLSYMQQGNEIWKNFNQKDPAEHYWYYRTIAEYLEELSDTAAYQEYVQLIKKVFE